MVNAYLERVDFRYRLLATIFLMLVREEHDIFAHSLHIRVARHNLVVLQLRIQYCSVEEILSDCVSLAERNPYRIW